MSTITPNLGLTVWSGPGDQFNYTELANNFITLDNQFSPISVSLTPIRFIEMVSVVPSPGTQGRLIYLTANNSGFVANTILRDSGSAWAPVGPPEIQSGLPISNNFAGRIVILSSAVSGFNAWDVVINTDGANSWQLVGGVSRSATVAGFTNNFAGKLGVLTAADSGFDAYSLLVYTGSAWQAVDTRGVLTGPTLPASPYTGQLFVLTASSGNFSAYDVMEWNGSFWRVISKPPLLSTAQFASLATPNDQFEVYLQVDATNGVVWHLRYNAGSVSNYKWEFLGGVPLFNEVTTEGSVTATSYTDLSGGGTGPTLTLPFSGDYNIEIGGRGKSDSWHTLSAYQIGSTAASDSDAMQVDTSFGTSLMRLRRKNSLTAVTITMKYRVNNAAATAAWKDRWMKITPIRINQT